VSDVKQISIAKKKYTGSTSRESKRRTDKPAACFRARYSTDLMNSDLVTLNGKD